MYKHILNGYVWAVLLHLYTTQGGFSANFYQFLNKVPWLCASFSLNCTLCPSHIAT